MPLMVAALGWALKGERIAPLGVAGLVAGFVGVGLIMGTRLTGGADPLGVALCVLGALALAIATLTLRGASSGGNLLMVVGLQMLVGALSLGLISAVTDPLAERPQPAFFAAFAYQIAVPGLAATLIWFALVGRIGSTRAATFHFLNPFFGVAIAPALLGEVVRPLDMMGVPSPWPVSLPCNCRAPRKTEGRQQDGPDPAAACDLGDLDGARLAARHPVADQRVIGRGIGEPDIGTVQQDIRRAELIAQQPRALFQRRCAGGPRRSCGHAATAADHPGMRDPAASMMKVRLQHALIPGHPASRIRPSPACRVSGPGHCRGKVLVRCNMIAPRSVITRQPWCEPARAPCPRDAGSPDRARPTRPSGDRHFADLDPVRIPISSISLRMAWTGFAANGSGSACLFSFVFDALLISLAPVLLPVPVRMNMTIQIRPPVPPAAAFRMLPQPVTAARLAEETGVSERTLYRDIQRPAGRRVR
jgi:hypothetical protein